MNLLPMSPVHTLGNYFVPPCHSGESTSLDSFPNLESIALYVSESVSLEIKLSAIANKSSPKHSIAFGTSSAIESMP